MRLLFDADMLLYRVGFRYDEKSEEECLEGLLSSLDWTRDIVQADTEEYYLSCPRNKSFRYLLNNNYKANRTDRKPVHFEFLRNYLITSLNAVVPEDEEADDLIGIEQWMDEGNTICCTVDKDILYGVVGGKFNFMNGEVFYTSPDDATYFFYRQLLMGDNADNVEGISKIGEVKSRKILEPYYGDEEALYCKVLSVYENHYGEKAKEKLLLAGRMLKIRTYPDEVWELPFD
jgi:hypothetical protein